MRSSKLDHRTARRLAAAKLICLGAAMVQLSPEYTAAPAPEYRPAPWIDPERIQRFIRRVTKPARHSRNKFSHQPQATIALVQSAKNTLGGSVTTIAQAYGSNVTSGNLLIASIGANANPPPTLPSSVTDTLGNAWHLAAREQAAIFSGSWMYYTVTASSGADTVTVTFGSGASLDLIVVEYSGLLNASPLDTFSSATSTSTPLTTGNITTQTANDLLVITAYDNENNSPNPTFTSSLGTQRQQTINPSNGSLVLFDDYPVSAGNYNASLTDSHLSGNGWTVMLVAFRSNLPSVGFVQSETNTVTSATSCAKAFDFSNTLGNCLVAAVGLNSTNSCTIADSQSNTWYEAGTILVSGRSLTIFFAPNCKAGANTVTASFSSSGATLQIVEYVGIVSAHVLDKTTFNNFNGTGGTGTIYIDTANEVAVGVYYETNNNGATFTSTGYAQHAYNGLNGAMGLFDALISSPASTTNTITCSASSNSVYGFIALRSALPSVGYLQATQSASASVAYIEPNTAGNLLLALSLNPTAGVIDTQSNTWLEAPAQFSQDAGGGVIFYAANCAAGANTVTSTSATALMIFEYAGLSAVNPLMAATGFGTYSGSTATSGTISTAGTVLLFSTMCDFTASGRTFTPTSGYNAIISQNSGSPCMSAWSQIVTSPGAQANVVTGSGAYTDGQCSLIAFSTAAISFPVLRQCCWVGSNVGADSPKTCTFLENVVAGNLIVACFANQTGSTQGTISDSQSNTYSLIYGGSGQAYGLWFAIASSSGSLAVTNTLANCGGACEVANLKSSAIDQQNTASNTGTTVGTGSITTTKQPGIVFAFGFVNAKVTVDSVSSGWGGANTPAGHLSTIGMAYQSNAQIGSFSNTFTFSASQANVGVIVSFYATASAFVLPQINCGA